MDLNFGGPVWHASVVAATPQSSRILAEQALQGRGDASLGEWVEQPMRAVQIRRRLTPDETILAGGLIMIDIRGEPEEKKRMNALFRDVPWLKQFMTPSNIGRS